MAMAFCRSNRFINSLIGFNRFFPSCPFGPPPTLPSRGVVVTGLGMVTPLGCGSEATWKCLIEGECGIRAITIEDLKMNGFDVETQQQTFDQLTSKVAGVVPCRFNPREFDEEFWLHSKVDAVYLNSHHKGKLVPGYIWTSLMFTTSRCLKTLNSQFRNPSLYMFVSQIHNQTSKNPSLYNPAVQFVLNEAREFQSMVAREEKGALSPHKHKDCNVQIFHPWPEWADLMMKLLKTGYFDRIGNPFANNKELGKEEANYIRTACLNFARDQYQLIRCLSQRDILSIVELGCPSTDRKVVNSGKRLRAHVGVEEGNVCSSCVLRGDCDRAYIKAREDEGGRTVDIMRLLVAYGLDPIMGSVENKPCLNKRVEESIRMLLKEMVDNSVEGQDLQPQEETASECKISSENNNDDSARRQSTVPMKQGDWMCPKCNFLNFSRNIKCLRCDTFCEERLKRLAEKQEHLPLKKGDWICDKCKFLNFARNTRCLQCRENPPKRELNPGEWQCDSCNYINFRRNMVCLKCDHRRPIASNTMNIAPRSQNNNSKNHPMHHPRFAREEQGMHGGYNDVLQSVKSDNRKHGATVFVDFPISGGKSDLSCNERKRELWKMEMKNRSRTATREAAGFEPGEIEFLATGDDDEDDEMADWFEGGKKT